MSIGKRVASIYAEIGADTTGLKRALATVKTGLKSAVGDFKNFGSLSKMPFTEISSAIGLASKSLGSLQGFIRDTAGEVVNYANQVRSLTTAIGATPQEASKLIQVADDVNISYQQLTSALEAGIRKGVKPTIDNLGAMSNEYLKLQPGIERTEYLMEKFGRTGQDLARLMELGSDKIGEMGDSIEGTARLMDQEGLDAAEDYRVALDDLSDAAEDVKLSIGQSLIPELQKVADVMTRNIEVTRILNEAEDAELITTLERTRAGSFLFGSEEKNLAQVKEIEEELVRYKRRMDDLAMSSRGYSVATANAEAATDDLVTPMMELRRATEGTSRQMDGYSAGIPVAMDLTRKLGESADSASGSVKTIGNAADHAKSRLDILNGFNLDLAGQINDELDRIDWVRLGGPALEQELAALPGRLAAHLITEPEYEAELKKLQGMAIVAQGEIDGMDASEVSKELSDQLGIPFTEADKLRATLETNLGALTMREWVIKMRVDVTGYPPGLGGLPTVQPEMGLPGAKSWKPPQSGPIQGVRDAGGPVSAGSSYVIGLNRQPEIFTPNVSGAVTPINGLGGGDTYVSITISTLPGQSAPAIAAATVAAIGRANNRSRAGMSYAGV